MDFFPIVLVALFVFHLSLSSKAFILTEEFTWRTYDENSDGSLDSDEFDTMTRYMFRNTTGDPHPIEEQLVTEIFDIFDGNADGVIDKKEFSHCWSCWVKNVLSPRSALIIIDVQNDFVNGSLAISNGPAQQDGAEVIGPINNLLEEVSFDAIFYSKDWHPQNHISFYDNVCQRELDDSSSTTNCSEVNLFDTVVFKGPPMTEQKLWPTHCVQESWGSQLHPDLKVAPDSEVILKGSNPNFDSYSAFFDNQRLGQTELQAKLEKLNITDVYVGGLATDYCVGYTSLHSLELGFRTVVLEDCSRGIQSEAIKKTLDSVRSRNGLVAKSKEVKSMVDGNDRRVTLGLHLALKCKNTSS